MPTPKYTGRGSVFKRRGKWTAQIKTPDGKKTATATTKALAWLEVDRLKRRWLPRDLQPNAGRITFAEFVTSWMANVRQVQVKPQTHQNDFSLLSVHLMPHLGPLPVASITVADAAAIMNAAQVRTVFDKEGNAIKRKTSKATQRHVYNFASVIFDYAKGSRLIAENPMSELERPIADGNPRKAWDKEQLGAYLAAAPRVKNSLPCVLIALTGLSTGELAALYVQDYDPKTNTINVERGGKWLKKQFIEHSPKTKKRVRTVYLPPELKPQMMDHLRARLASGVGSDRLFCSEVGTPLRMDNIRKRQHIAIIAAAKLPYIPLHALRNTYATLAASQDGASLPDIANQLGHDPATMLRHYAQSQDSGRRAIASGFGELISQVAAK